MVASHVSKSFVGRIALGEWSGVRLPWWGLRLPWWGLRLGCAPLMVGLPAWPGCSPSVARAVGKLYPEEGSTKGSCIQSSWAVAGERGGRSWAVVCTERALLFPPLPRRFPSPLSLPLPLSPSLPLSLTFLKCSCGALRTTYWSTVCDGDQRDSPPSSVPQSSRVH